MRQPAPCRSFVALIPESPRIWDQPFVVTIAGLVFHVNLRQKAGQTDKRHVGRKCLTTAIDGINISPLLARRARHEAFAQVGVQEAEKHLQNDSYEVRPIRWSGKCRFRSEAKPGDLVVEILTQKRGKRKYIRVYPPAPILHRQDEARWTRFYIEVPVERSDYLWRDIKADFASLGVLNVSPDSTRELTGKALGILQLME
jgi:hypothetical protein